MLHLRFMLEELGKTQQGRVATLEVVTHVHVGAGSVELHVDLLVDQRLAALGVLRAGG